MSNDHKSSVTLSSTYAVILSRYLSAIKSPNKKLDYQHANSFLNNYIERQITLKELTHLTKLIAGETGDYGFGLQVGRNIHPSDYGLVGYMLMNSRTLFEATELAAQYKHRLNKGLLASIERKGDEIIYHVENTFNLDVMKPMVELDFASAIQFARLLAGPHKQKGMKLKMVAFQHEPLTSEKHYHDCFQCPVSFDKEQNQLVIEYEMLDTPVYGANSKILMMLKKKLQQQDRNGTRKLSARVHSYLRGYLGEELPDLVVTAKHFHMSLSAFKKHLQLEGTSFQQISDVIRRDDACRMLNGTSMTVKEIGFRLGFSSTSAFTRAFKRWMEVGPSEFKKTV